MKPSYNSLNAFENLMIILDKEGKIQITPKEVIEVCRFLEATYFDGFNDNSTFLSNQSNEFNLREIRKKYKLTQEQFGLKLGVTRGRIAQIETGKNAITKNFDKKIQNFLNSNPL